MVMLIADSAQAQTVSSGPGRGALEEDGQVRTGEKAAETPFPTRPLAGRSAFIKAIAFDPAGDRLVASCRHLTLEDSSGWSNSLRVWDANTGALLHILMGEGKGDGDPPPVFSVAFSSNRGAGKAE